MGLALWISSSPSMAELPGLNIVFVVHAFDIVTFIWSFKDRHFYGLSLTPFPVNGVYMMYPCLTYVANREFIFDTIHSGYPDVPLVHICLIYMLT